MNRQISEQGLALIRRFEGFSAKPYLCPAGHLTIGYGHVVRPGEEFAAPLSEAQADALLKKDVAAAQRAVTRLITAPLTQSRFDALVSFTFNVGAGALQRSALRRKVNRGEHAAVEAEFLKWIWAGGKRSPGLVRRRMAEAALYDIASRALIAAPSVPSSR